MNDNSTFVLTNNFDDIKNSEYMSEIRNRWSNLGFTSNLTDEKRDNLSICYEQLSEYLLHYDMIDYDNVNSNLYFDTLFPNQNIKESFYTYLFPILYRVYKALPLSDYDYKEFLNAFKTVRINSEECAEIQNASDIEAYYASMIADKIINVISSK